jgi:hypothetical protein
MYLSLWDSFPRKRSFSGVSLYVALQASFASLVSPILSLLNQGPLSHWVGWAYVMALTGRL